MASAGGARVGDAERQAVVDLLRHHTGAGRLTLDEFAERAGQVYAAVTRDDLAKVVADLPDGVRPEPTGPGAAAAKPVSTPSPAPATGERSSRTRRTFVAIMGGSDSRGPWHAPDEINAFAFWGGVDIDLRNARIESPVVEITAWAIMGGVTITVPPGIPVELSGFVLMGGSTNMARSEDPIPGAPIIRVKARGMWGGVTVRNPRRRRWQRDRDRRSRYQHHSSHRDRYAEDPPELTSGTASDEIPAMPSAADTALASNPTRTAPPTPPTPPVPPQPPQPPQPAQPPQPVQSPQPTQPAQVSTSPGATAPNGIGSGSSSGLSTLRVGGDIPPGTLTILISDITGSTQLAERFGDQVWLEVLQTHNAIVRGRLAEYGGTEVKAQGDGFLVVFPSARSAVLAAIAIQKAMADYRDRHPEQGVQLRVGLHTGEVVTSDGDIFGHNVVVASRIADAAGPGEILVSRLTRDLTASASDLGFDSGEDVDLKGVSEPWRVHRVVWE